MVTVARTVASRSARPLVETPVTNQIRPALLGIVSDKRLRRVSNRDQLTGRATAGPAIEAQSILSQWHKYRRLRVYIRCR